MVKREEIIMFRATKLEKKLIQNKAKSINLSTAKYCREICLEHKVRNQMPEEVLTAFKDLHQYHNNFKKIHNLLKNKDSDFAKKVMNTANEIKKSIEIIMEIK